MGNDRRGTGKPEAGVNRVITTDGNGGKTDTIQFNIARAKVMVNFAKALVALLIIVGGAVWGGVRWGINAEVHSEVETAIADGCAPGGKINMHVRHISEEYMDEVQGVLQDDLDNLDDELKGMKTSVDTLVANTTHNTDEIKMLLQRAINDGGGG
jgi:hypothetical protein